MRVVGRDKKSYGITDKIGGAGAETAGKRGSVLHKPDLCRK